MSPPPHAPSAPGLVLLACTLGFVLISLDITVVNVALETLRAAFGSSVGGLQWVLNGYTLAFASLLLSTGALGDRLGHRPMLLAGLALFTLASIGCGLAGSIGMLVAARVLQGVGAALCVPASLTLINLTFPERRARARAIGIWAGTASMAMGAGPIVGGLLVSHFGWPSIFFINVPFGIAGLWLTLAHAPRRPRGPARGFDLPGQLMAILALAGLAIACIESGQTGWTSAPVIGGGAAFLLCGTAFFALEARSRAPMLPLGLFASAPLRCASAIGLLLNFGYYGVMFAISLYFQAAKGYGPLAAGLAFLPMTAVLSGVNFAAGRLDARFGSRRVIRAGLGLSLLSYLSVSGITAATPYALIMLALVAIGIGMALCVPAISTVLMEDTPAERAGIASGLFNTARQLGGVIGVGIFGSLLATGADLAAGMRLAFLLSSLAMLLALGVAQRGLRPGAAGPAARRA